MWEPLGEDEFTRLGYETTRIKLVICESDFCPGPDLQGTAKRSTLELVSFSSLLARFVAAPNVVSWINRRVSQEIAKCSARGTDNRCLALQRANMSAIILESNEQNDCADQIRDGRLPLVGNVPLLVSESSPGLAIV
jgi:hypothetical protein